MRYLLSSLFVLAAAASLTWISGADESKPSKPEVAAETLMPLNSFVAMTYDGTEAHMPAIKETAAWKALEETELTARLLDLGQMFVSAAGEQNGVLAREAIEHLRANGFSLAGSMSGSGEGFTPYGVIIFHGAGNFVDTLQPMVEQIATSEGEEVEQKTVEGRDVAFIGTNVPDVEVSWWNESGHLVIGVGLRASEQIIATATGETENITKNAKWTQLRKSEQYSVDALAWVDTGLLLDQLLVKFIFQAIALW